MINPKLLGYAFPINKVEVFFDNLDHSNFLGFTWERIGSGRVPVGIDVNDTDFNTIGKTGGEKTHTLTVGEIPDHNHAMNNFSSSGNKNQFHTVNEFYSYHGDQSYWNYDNPNVWTSRTGGGQAHNNLQPYIVMAFWKRIS